MRVCCWMLLTLGLATGCAGFQPNPAPAPLATPQAAAPATVKLPDPPKPAAEVLRIAATVPATPQATEAPDPLAGVAECLARDDVLGAAAHLDAYVRANPEQPLFRFQLAELYLRGGRTATAKFHYERFVTDAQSGHASLRPHLVTAHTNLMAIAQGTGDRFGELFHRGAGLLCLLAELDGDPDRDDGFCEELLCKALLALRDAKDLRPNDARVRVYLARAYDRTGNARAATAERVGAKSGVTESGLTPAEKRDVLLRE